MTKLSVAQAGNPAGDRQHLRSRFAQRLLVSASAGVLASLLPAMAFGQAVPAGCVPSPATAGDTIDCVAIAPVTVDGIATTVDDLTINVGSLVTPTAVLNLSGDGINMAGSGALTLNVVGAGSSVTASGHGVYMFGDGALSVTSAGGIYAQGSGVVALGVGAAGSTILDLATVRSAGQAAIYGRGLADLSITAHGAVTAGTAGEWGILAVGNGTGSVTVNAADVSASGGVLDSQGAGIFGYLVSGTDLAITSTGTVSGDASGILAFGQGSGSVTVNAVNATGGTYFGIGALTDPSGTDAFVTATGTVTGSLIGIGVQTAGSGAVVVDAATVTGTDVYGIAVANSAAGTDISVTASGTVTGGQFGIHTVNYGAGSLTINAAAVTGTVYDGIYAYNSAAGTDLSITATGAVTGGVYGIYADNYGTGALSIATAAVTGTLGDGIIAYNSAAGTDLSITSSGAVTGGEYGIHAINLGTGSLTISAAAVTGTTADGILARNSVAGTDLTVTATGTVFGNSFGIDAANYGTGAVNVTTQAVTGTLIFGIGAYNSAAGTDLSITANGDVTGGEFGIYTINAGTGSLTVNAGAVTGNGVDGIDAQNTAAGTSISVTTTGLVTGVHDGIDVDNYGSGALTINAAAITAGHDGIEAVNSAAGTDLTITASGAIAGGIYGIYAANSGSGALTINAAAITAGLDGIEAVNSANGTDLTIAASGAITGGSHGIHATNNGSGALSIEAAAVTATNAFGIRATNSTAGTDLTIAASGAIAGDLFGVLAQNNGSGALSVTTAAVTGTGSSGIDATNSAAGTGLTISASGAVAGGGDGISARNFGSGALSITAAAVTGTGSSGISARNAATGTDLTIGASGAVAGGGYGVDARNSGTGALSVTTAAVTGMNISGINATNSAAGTGLTIVANGAVNGATTGIYARNDGTGVLSIATAAVTSPTGDGIHARNAATGTGLTISASGAVTGAVDAIDVLHSGTGDLTLDVAAATGLAGHAIYARNTALGSNLSVTASGLVTGTWDGINATNFGGGALTINAAAVIAGYNGIEAYNSAAGTDLTITASGVIDGGENGVYAQNYGSGALSIMTAAASGSSERGIDARNYTGATDLTILATGALTGGQDGIVALNSGTGAVSVTTAAVTGVAGDGIFAQNDATGTDLVIAASGAVAGARYGIVAQNSGTGGVTIDVAGIAGTNAAGILARNSGAGDLSITATGAVSGGTAGIQVSAFGGEVSVDAADVTGTSQDGIRVYAGYGTLSASIISSGLVSGGTSGIDVTHSGSGPLSINAVDVSGGAGGISASTGSGSAGASITATGAVTGDTYGLVVRHRGAGNLAIDVATVSGLSGAGIEAWTYAATTGLSITASGAVTGGTNGVEVRPAYGTGSVELNLASVTGLSGHGISVSNSPFGTDLTVSATGSVIGADRGMEVSGLGSGAVTIEVADVTGTSREGIYAVNSSAGTDLSITSSGQVTGGGLAGLGATQFGSGLLAIDVVNVTGTAGYGISAYSANGASLTSTGTIAGASSGITLHAASGDLSLDVNHATGASSYGIRATIGAVANSLSITSHGLVMGGTDGISARHEGSGALSIDAVDVTAGRTGISATTLASTTDMSINVTGTVTSVADGVYARLTGTGALTIAVADVNAAAGYGVLARNIAGTGLSVTATGSITGYGGINARNYGSGATVIDAAAVTGLSSGGIRVYGGATTTDMSITASGAVTGPRSGIFVDHRGSGVLTIDAGAVTATASGFTSVGNGTAINATTTGAGLSIVTSGAVTGVASGIDVTNFGSGVLTVHAAQLTGTTYYGITAIGSYAGTDINMTATGAIYGGRTGVRTRNLGYGATMIDITSAAGGSSAGIFAEGGSNTTDLSISATDTVSGGEDGVIAEWAGSGAVAVGVADATGMTGYGIFLRSTNGSGISLTASGAVSGATNGVTIRNFGTGATVIDVASATGGSGIGVYASGDASTTGLSITASGTVSGGRNGIMALWSGSGALTVDVADVAGASDTGIFLQSTYGTGISLAASGAVTGGFDGITANHFGTGAVSINVAEVSGGAGGYAGISTYNGAYGSDLSLTASGAVTGDRFGIRARNTGSGVVDISATDVTSTSGVAIHVRGSGTDIGVTTTGTVTGQTGGIYVNNRGSGSTTVSTANVFSDSDSGIYAINQGAGLTITSTGTVTGGTGISALQYGSGALNVEVAAVNGTTGDGILAYQSYAGSDLSVSATGTVTGDNTGITAVNYGSGTLAISAASVSSLTGSAIEARSGRFSSGLSVSASGIVSGGWGGITLSNRGSGALTLTAVDVDGGIGLGINAYGGQSTTDMTVTAANVTSGIRLWALGTGVTSLNVGNVTSAYGSAINAYAGSNSAGLDVTVTGAIHGADTGISASNRSAIGSVSIAAAGAVAGDSAFGISAYNAGSGGLSITTAGDVTGGIVGLFARNLGGALTLDIGGDITGGDIGLWTDADYGMDFDVRVGQTISGGTWGIVTGGTTSAATSSDTLNIFGTVNGHIGTGNGDDVVGLAAGSVVNGAILLDAGDDTLNWQGGGFGGARAGDGIDTVNFSGPGVRITNSGNAADIFVDFELYHFLGGGYVLDGLHTGLIATYFDAGDNILLGTLASQNVMIAAGAGLEVANGALITGNLNNAGSLGINRTAIGVFTVDGDFTQLATGDLTLDANAFSGWGDQVVVSGELALGGELALRQSGNFGTPLTLIDGGTGLTGSFDSVTGLLVSRLLVSQSIAYDAVNFDVNLVTEFADATRVSGLTPNQASVANGLTGQLSTLPDNQAFTDLAYSVVSIGDGPALAAALEALNPEILDAGIQTARNSQFLFLTGLMDRNGAPAPGPQPVQVASLDNSIPDWSSPEDTAHVWGALQMASYEQTGGGVNIDYATDGVEIAFGAADLTAGAIRFGFAVGYAGLETDLAAPDDDHVASELFRYGLFGRYDINAGDTGLQAHLDGSLALGRGSLETRMDVLLPSVTLTQTGETHFNTAAGAVRLTLDGYNGDSWLVRPHLLVAADRYDQNAQMIGYGTTTVIASDSFQLDRVSYGYGATFEHQWGTGSALEISATSLRHSGDAAAAFSSSFAAPGLSAVGFNIAGREIEQQYIVQGRFRSELADGLTVSVEGFAEFGDLEGAGAEVRLSKRF